MVKVGKDDATYDVYNREYERLRSQRRRRIANVQADPAHTAQDIQTINRITQYTHKQALATAQLAEAQKKLDKNALTDMIGKIGSLKVEQMGLPADSERLKEVNRQLAEYGRRYAAAYAAFKNNPLTTQGDIADITARNAENAEKIGKAAAAARDKVNDLNRSLAETGKNKALSEAMTLIGKIGSLETRMMSLPIDSAEYAEAGMQVAALRTEYERLMEYLYANEAFTDEDIHRIEQKRTEEIRKQNLEYAKQQDKLRGVKNTTSEVEKATERIWQRLVAMAALRAISHIWREALQYATEYYDKLNEIRLVTGMDQTSANAVGESYRALAQDMDVTSLSVVSGAASLYRQGLSDEEVIGRLEQITKWATVAGIDVAWATDLMTASINNFMEEGEDSAKLAEEIADTYAYYGDAVATGAEDIAVAMQKTAASASNAGMSLQRTGAYIATILSVTQEEPESIGNAWNTVVSRYSRITQTGYGKSFVDPETGEQAYVNDVVRALYDAAGIDAYDETTRTFMDFGAVLDQLAAKWDTLGQSEKNYIATQLAGTRQYNRVLTLMDNYGIAMELLEGSYTATGTTAQKYAVWTESVAASQNDLANSLEELYALLDGEVLKDFYTAGAGLIDVFVAGLEATDAMPIKLTA